MKRTVLMLMLPLMITACGKKNDIEGTFTGKQSVTLTGASGAETTSTIRIDDNGDSATVTLTSTFGTSQATGKIVDGDTVENLSFTINGNQVLTTALNSGRPAQLGYLGASAQYLNNGTNNQNPCVNSVTGSIHVVNKKLTANFTNPNTAPNGCSVNSMTLDATQDNSN